MIRPDIILVNRNKIETERGMLGRILIPEERINGQWILRQYATLERRWKNNEPRESAIPDGTYPLIKRTVGGYAKKHRTDPRFNGHAFVPEIANVPGRSAVLLHEGNWERNSTGCILIGYPDKDRSPELEPFIKNSVPAFNIVFDLISKLLDRGSVVIDIHTHGEPKCIVEGEK